MNYHSHPHRYTGGQAMIAAVLFFLAISFIIVIGVSAPIVEEIKIANTILSSKATYFLSEAGVEDVMYRLKNGIPVSSTETLTLGGSMVTSSVTTDSQGKTIIAEGDRQDNIRKIQAKVRTGVGVAFNYAVQVGAGGLSMDNNATVNGSVYSNGPITGSNGATITGAAASANSASLYADQSNGSGVPAYDISFGNANGTQDFAQSFRVSTTAVANKVDLYLKKNNSSNPGNLTVKIVTNSGSSPGTTILTSGSLSASLVSTTYGWVSVPLSSSPELTAGTTYWIVIDGSTNAARYYMIGANNNGYSNGTGKIGQSPSTWSNTSPSGLDGFFKLYLGGLTGSIEDVTIGVGGVGNAYANTINNSNVAGTKYCQISNNSPACNTSLPDPTQVAMPISDQNILDWKAEAEAGGSRSSYTLNGSAASLGPEKITGNLTVDNNADLTVNGTLWVEGNMLVDNNATIRLSSSYGASEGVIIVGGTITINNNAIFAGSGTSGSYLMALSTSNSSSAITLNNNGGAVILYATNGTIDVANNASAKSLTAKHIHLNPNAEIIYDSGLADSNFVNGPSGGYNITDWKEIE